jgi:hypothetical protein
MVRVCLNCGANSMWNMLAAESHAPIAVPVCLRARVGLVTKLPGKWRRNE